MIPTSKRITLSDVAKEAGVSVQTASHVMAQNMTVRLPQATRQRVMEAAKMVGYRPNRVAQAMKAGKTNLIGVWIPLDRPVLSYLRGIQEINLHSKTCGYDLMIKGLDDQMAFSGEGRAPFSWPIDGLIAYDAGKAAGHFRQNPQNDSIPLVVVGFEQYPNSDSVAWNPHAAYKRIVASQISRGMRRIVHVTPDWVFENYPREQRRRGYQEAMEEAGLEPTFITTCEESINGAMQSTLSALESGLKPECVMAFTDTLAIGSGTALLERGFDIPSDCAVWGYGDYPESEFFRVPLSTVRVPIKETVNSAWEMLMKRIKEPTTEGRLEVLSMEIVERSSGRLLD